VHRIHHELLGYLGANNRRDETVGQATAEPVPEVMTGGRYLFGPFGDKPSLTIAATGPDGWVGYPSWVMDVPEPVRADAPTGIGISFFTANGGHQVVDTRTDRHVADLRATGARIQRPVPLGGAGPGHRIREGVIRY
jgi:hypothetical protein